MLTEAGPVPLEVPGIGRVRSPHGWVPGGQRRIGGLDDMIISLYAGGMTFVTSSFTSRRRSGTEISHETISKIVDAISEEVLSWQHRPLEPLYPVIYLDAMVVKVKDGGHTRNKDRSYLAGRRYGRDQACSGHLFNRNEGPRFGPVGRSGQPAASGTSWSCAATG